VPARRQKARAGAVAISARQTTMRDALLLLSLVTTSTHALLQPVKRRPPIAAARAVDSATPRPLKSSDKMVKPIVDEDSFLAAMAQSAGDRVVAIKFYASWCRACKSIAPRFERLARDYDGEAAFFEIEFASNKDLCRRLEIKKLPCVQRAGRVLLAGASSTRVEESYLHSTDASSARLCLDACRGGAISLRPMRPRRVEGGEPRPWRASRGSGAASRSFEGGRPSKRPLLEERRRLFDARRQGRATAGRHRFFRGSDGCIDTVMCGPSKFPEVKVALEKHIHHDVPYEYTDVSSHYDD